MFVKARPSAAAIDIGPELRICKEKICLLESASSARFDYVRTDIQICPKYDKIFVFLSFTCTNTDLSVSFIELSHLNRYIRE